MKVLTNTHPERMGGGYGRCKDYVVFIDIKDLDGDPNTHFLPGFIGSGNIIDTLFIPMDTYFFKSPLWTKYLIHKCNVKTRYHYYLAGGNMDL